MSVTLRVRGIERLPEIFDSGLGARPTIDIRFWSKVQKSKNKDVCWPWLAAKRYFGYGQFWYNNRNLSAHRIAWELVFGPVPNGLLVCHACDNPPCCNPNHLFLGTRKDNSADMLAKGRQASGLRNGKYTKPWATPRGERHPSSKLSITQVRAIRSLWLMGVRNCVLLGRVAGVSHTSIWQVLHKKTWVRV